MPSTHATSSRRGVAAAVALMALALQVTTGSARAGDAAPTATDGDYVAHDFRFADGSTLPDLRLHYETLGTPKRDASGRITNAALLLHGTTGTGRQFLADTDLRELFGPGKPLDVTRFYVVLPDGIGAGGSSKPSDGLKAHFPHYGYGDQVEAQRRLVEDGLGVHHLDLVLGTSMGGMQAWLWAERHPAFMDATVAIAATPAPVDGRNMMWRDMVIDAIKADPDFRGGDYAGEPHQWRAVLPLFTLMTGDARHLQAEAPTRDAAAAFDAKLVAGGAKIDADDYLASFESSWDYDPSAALDRITGPLLSVNFGDDLLNPAELGRTEAAMAHVKTGTALLIPAGPGTYGHQTLAHPEVWGPALASFMAKLPRR
ncbi:MAG: alpha/beta fold hydrolase [Janthinobacterium lividum]